MGATSLLEDIEERLVESQISSTPELFARRNAARKLLGHLSDAKFPTRGNSRKMSSEEKAVYSEFIAALRGPSERPIGGGDAWYTEHTTRLSAAKYLSFVIRKCMRQGYNLTDFSSLRLLNRILKKDELAAKIIIDEAEIWIRSLDADAEWFTSRISDFLSVWKRHRTHSKRFEVDDPNSGRALLFRRYCKLLLGCIVRKGNPPQEFLQLLTDLRALPVLHSVFAEEVQSAILAASRQPRGKG